MRAHAMAPPLALHEARVVAAWRPTPSTRAIRLERPPGFAHEAGQSLFLFLGAERRPLSLASGPAREHLELAVRDGPSAFKRAFAALGPGDAVRFAGPRGGLRLDPTRPALLLAGGIGITPMKALLEDAIDRRLPIPLALLASSRSADEIAFREEIEEMRRRHRALDVVHTLTRGDERDGWTGRRGRVDDALVREALARHPDAAAYVAGPPGFVESARGALAAAGVEDARIHAESFWGYGRPPGA